MMIMPPSSRSACCVQCFLRELRRGGDSGNVGLAVLELGDRMHVEALQGVELPHGLAGGETVILQFLLAPPSPSLLEHLPKGEWGAAE